MHPYLSQMEDEWIPFDAIDLIPKRCRPRVMVRRFFEINPLGKIRYLDPSKPRWVDVPTIQLNGEPYLVTVVGFSSSMAVRVKVRVAELIEKHFKQPSQLSNKQV